MFTWLIANLVPILRSELTSCEVVSVEPTSCRKFKGGTAEMRCAYVTFKATICDNQTDTIRSAVYLSDWRVGQNTSCAYNPRSCLLLNAEFKGEISGVAIAFTAIMFAFFVGVIVMLYVIKTVSSRWNSWRYETNPDNCERHCGNLAGCYAIAPCCQDMTTPLDLEARG